MLSINGVKQVTRHRKDLSFSHLGDRLWWNSKNDILLAIIIVRIFRILSHQCARWLQTRLLPLTESLPGFALGPIS